MNLMSRLSQKEQQELREKLNLKKKILIRGKRVFEMTLIRHLSYQTRQEYIDQFLRDPLLNFALFCYSQKLLEEFCSQANSATLVNSMDSLLKLTYEYSSLLSHKWLTKVTENLSPLFRYTKDLSLSQNSSIWQMITINYKPLN